MRVHFQNVQGINSKSLEADFDLWLQAMLSVESDIIMLTELTLTRLGTLNHKRGVHRSRSLGYLLPLFRKLF